MTEQLEFKFDLPAVNSRRKLAKTKYLLYYRKLRRRQPLAWEMKI